MAGFGVDTVLDETEEELISARRHRLGLRRLTIAGLAATIVLMLLPNQAPGTVEEQRARLPPPAFCDDPVEGVWRSHQFNPRFQDWEEFTLDIYHVEGRSNQLEGEITNHGWEGDHTMEQPGPCRGRLHYLVGMEAEGHFEERPDGQVYIEFGGVGEWRMEQMYCGSSAYFGYNLDNFSGEIDPEIQEFQSVNNDGGRAVNAPTVFRRVRCHEPPPPTEISVSPPPFLPEQRTDEGGGCSQTNGPARRALWAAPTRLDQQER